MSHANLTSKLIVSLCLLGTSPSLLAQPLTNRAAKKIMRADAQASSVELLNDPFFYDFTAGKPDKWLTVGTITQLSAGERYSSDTGFAIGIDTKANEEGFLKQVIDLKQAGKEVSEGDELECLIHYYTLQSRRSDGPFRLSLQWLDVDGKEIVTSEKDFIDNPEIYFGRMKAYGTLKFRTTCPIGAVKLSFALIVAPESQVRMDDFSVLRLAEKDKTPLVAILPQYRTILGEVNVPKEYPVALQGAHLSQDMPPSFAGGYKANTVMKLSIDKLPKNGTTKAVLTMTPQRAGVFEGSGTYKLTFSGTDPDNKGVLNLTSYFKKAGTTPTISLKAGQTIRNFTAAPNKTDILPVEFLINDVITNVNIKVDQKPNGPFRIDKTQFYYGASSGKLFQSPVNITFAPREPGDYEATLMVSTVLADTLKVKLKGTAEAATTTDIIERFSADRPMDNRFKGEAWKGYHKFDQGYWKISGVWNGAGKVSLVANDTLYYDEVLANGVNTLVLSPIASARKLTAQYSLDGGGHWLNAPTSSATGSFTLNTHRPTLVRFLSPEALIVQSVTISPNNLETRQKLETLEQTMFFNADKEPLTVLNETFNGLRHTRVLSLPGWQNIAVNGERPFYAWQQKDAAQTVVENEVAQISFLKYGVVDKREHESWLISPTLSYKQAKSKILTFSLMFRNPTSTGEEVFGVYLIGEQDGKSTVNFLDLSSFVPEGIKIEPDMWFDYYIDLSKLEGLTIDDKFHIAFDYYSPVGGNETSLNYMIDDVTFGRTDLPELSIDNDFIKFLFHPGQEMTPQVLNVFTDRTKAPVTVTLTPSLQKKYFAVSSEKLPKEGGTLAVGFKSDDSKNHAAALLIQSRGAEPIVVKLLAQPAGNGISSVNSSDGDTFAPNINGSVLTFKGKFNHYQLYSVAGQLLQQGNYTENINLDHVPSGIIVLRLMTDQGIKIYRFKK